MFDPTKPVQTRDGRKARIICTDADDPRYPIVALSRSPVNGREIVNQHTIDGRLYGSGPEITADLINIPERTRRWYNFYEPYRVRGSYPSKDFAITRRDPTRVALLEIIFEEGKPVDVKLHKDGDDK